MTKLCRSFATSSRDGQCPNQVVGDSDLCERHLVMMSKQPNRCGSDRVDYLTSQGVTSSGTDEALNQRAIDEAPFAKVEVPPRVDETLFTGLTEEQKV